MQTTDNATTSFEGASAQPMGGAQATGAAQALAPNTTYADYKVIRRNGSVVSFEPTKINSRISPTDGPTVISKSRMPDSPGCKVYGWTSARVHAQVV